MAENLDDGEFWLPPQFLTDDDDNTSLAAKNDDVSRSLFLSSSSETESDEEDQLAELTRRVALGLDLDLNTSAKPKGVFGGGSPQSTLSAFGSSGKGSSPNGAVPPHANTWDLLREAAGEVERMQLNGENSNDRYGYNFPKSNAVNSNGVIGLGFYPQSLSQQQFQIAQFEMMRKQQMAKQQQQRQMVPPHNRGRNNNNNNVNVNVVGMGLSASAWHPPPPPPHGSGMGPVFLAGKRESAGTGVFLPRSVHSRNNNNNNESRKKPGCNNVYVPDRVVQALNLNSKGVTVGGHLQQQHKPRFNGENVSAVSRVKNNNNNNHHYGYSHSHHQKRNNLKHQHQPQQPLVVNHEIHLPQEWTY